MKSERKVYNFKIYKAIILASFVSFFNTAWSDETTQSKDKQLNRYKKQYDNSVQYFNSQKSTSDYSAYKAMREIMTKQFGTKRYISSEEYDEYTELLNESFEKDRSHWSNSYGQGAVSLYSGLKQDLQYYKPKDYKSPAERVQVEPSKPANEVSSKEPTSSSSTSINTHYVDSLEELFSVPSTQENEPAIKTDPKPSTAGTSIVSQKRQDDRTRNNSNYFTDKLKQLKSMNEQNRYHAARKLLEGSEWKEAKNQINSDKAFSIENEFIKNLTLPTALKNGLMDDRRAVYGKIRTYGMQVFKGGYINPDQAEKEITALVSKSGNTNRRSRLFFRDNNLREVTVGGTHREYYDTSLAELHRKTTDPQFANPNKAAGYDQRWKEGFDKANRAVAESKKNGGESVGMDSSDLAAVFGMRSFDPKDIDYKKFQDGYNSNPHNALARSHVHWSQGGFWINPSENNKYWALWTNNGIEAGVPVRLPNGLTLMQVTGKEYSEETGIPVGYFVDQFNGVFNQRGELTGFTAAGNISLEDFKPPYDFEEERPIQFEKELPIIYETLH